ncbi:sugar ABC transporter substrate-binding protein [Smaragdicoccus niigatensis]|uniref:sugar ABC transporter substrate-binding protein n=1 Tax=Smaragdicoccus niigatensis TaxID=359359 RepID=UPI0003742451|nr:substrate-binding domain-containing protein [Smaragdicoccus niigatensis]
MNRRTLLQLGALTVLSPSCSTGNDSSGSSSSSAPEVSTADLATFDSSLPAGPPTHLPRRAAWITTEEVEFFRQFGIGMNKAVASREVQYVEAYTTTNLVKNVRQLETALARGLGALAFQPSDYNAQLPVLEAALRQGVCLEGIITHPSTLQIAASQYDIGFRQGKGAADYALQHLNGLGRVHYTNSDTVPQLKIRHLGVLDGLKTAGDAVEVVSDLTWKDTASENVKAFMVALAAHPEINIILGGDGFVAPAYRAMEADGKLRPDMYFAGIDGDAKALELIRQDGPYRSTLAFGWQLMGYGIGWFAADWIEGKQIPRVLVAESILLDSAASIDTYVADNNSPAAVFADRAKYERYCPLLGNVSYATRDTVWRKEYIPK